MPVKTGVNRRKTLKTPVLDIHWSNYYRAAPRVEMSSIAMSVFIDCLSVRLHFLRPTRRNFTELSVHVTGSRGSVLWCQCDTLCTSGFEDYVVFSPNGANIPITDSVSSNSPGGDTGIVWGSLPCQTASCYGDDANHRYCNSLLVNCSNRNLHKLQRRVQDNLAGVVCNSKSPTAQHTLDHCYRNCNGCQSGSGSTSNSPNFVIWLLLSNSQATLLIWSAHTVGLVCCDHPHRTSVSSPHNLDTALVVSLLLLWDFGRNVLTDCAVRHRSVEESSNLELSSAERCRTAPFVNTFKIRLKTFLFNSA